MNNIGFPELHLRKKKTNVRRIVYFILFLFAQPEWITLVPGTALILIAVIIHGWAAGYLARAGYENRETVLTIRGPYRHNRNPYYVSHMMMDLGFFTAAGFFYLYPLYFPFIFLVYSTWVYGEEQFLSEEFGDTYRSIKKQVPRWWFRFTPAPSRGHKEVFTWKDYMENDELKRTLSHLFLIGVLCVFYNLENPLRWMSVPARMTLIAIYVLWFLYRDAYLEKAEQHKFGFLFTGIGVCFFSFTSYLLVNASTTFPIFWPVRILSVILIVLVCGYIFLPIHDWYSKFLKVHFRNKMTIVLELLIGMGLLSGSFFILQWFISLAVLIWGINVDRKNIVKNYISRGIAMIRTKVRKIQFPLIGDI